MIGPQISSAGDRLKAIKAAFSMQGINTKEP